MPRIGARKMPKVVLTTPDQTTAPMPPLVTPAPSRPPIKGVAGRGGDAEHPGEDVPDDRADQSREDHRGGDDLHVDDALADRVGDVEPEEEEGDEVEEGGPGDRELRAEHAGRYHRRDRIGGVVQAVQEIEQQGDADQGDQQGKGELPVHQA